MERAGANPLAANSDPSINNNLPIKRANENEVQRNQQHGLVDDETLKVLGESLCIERVYVLLD